MSQDSGCGPLSPPRAEGQAAPSTRVLDSCLTSMSRDSVTAAVCILVWGLRGLPLGWHAPK